MVVVGWDEITNGDDTGRLALEQVNHFPAELDQLGVAHRTFGTQKPRVCVWRWGLVVNPFDHFDTILCGGDVYTWNTSDEVF